MSLRTLIDGQFIADPQHAVAVDNRGLNYGDGLFETILLLDGRARYLTDHLARLKRGCERLRLQYPGDELLSAEIGRLIKDLHGGVIKVILARGAGGRGYRPAVNATSTRILCLHPTPAPYAAAGSGIHVRWCATRLGHNAALAGLKHLNRLEQVLAQSEWQPDLDANSCAEGLMCDANEDVICATAANLFAVIDSTLCTPLIDRCGIAGIMRAQVLKMAGAQGLAISERRIAAIELPRASEFFLTNAVRGIVPVIALDTQRWPVGAITTQLARTLKLW